MHELQKLTAPDGGTDNGFAHGLALSRNWMLVGDFPASGEKTPRAVIVYRRDDGGTPNDPTDDLWLLHQSLEAGGVGALNDDFAVTRALEVDSETGSAVLLVFRRSDNGTPSDLSDDVWIEQASLTASEPDGSIWRSSSAAISSDHIVVGNDESGDVCPGGGNCDSGAAYVFVRLDAGTPSDLSDDSWVLETRLTASDAAEFDKFGLRVDISGDWIIVGASGDDDACPELDPCSSGAAYMFRRDGSTWIEEQKLTASDAARVKIFGERVAIDGDVAVIGANQSDSNVGAAYVFRFDGADWIEAQKLTPSDGVPGDKFGTSVAVDGDLIAVGSVFDDIGCTIALHCGAGSVYVFRRDDGSTPSDPSDDTWPEDAKLFKSDRPVAHGPDLGTRVAIDGAWIIAEDESGTIQLPGAVYIFRARTDEDCNANGIDDSCERAIDVSLDCQPNGVPDECDVVSGASEDCNGNGIPDECEPDEDCNTNGVRDICDIGAGTSEDCNDNLIPDECEIDCNDNDRPDDCDITAGTATDCNGNSVLDECDVASGFSEDCDSNGFPDECEADCNLNGVPDRCDVAAGTSEDCNKNDNPDECDEDCNNNATPDDCDVAEGTSRDCNANGVPDECETDCQDNCIPDECDIVAGFSLDEDEDGIPDECTQSGNSLLRIGVDPPLPTAGGPVTITLEREFPNLCFAVCSVSDSLVGPSELHVDWFIRDLDDAPPDLECVIGTTTLLSEVNLGILTPGEYTVSVTVHLIGETGFCSAGTPIDEAQRTFRFAPDCNDNGSTDTCEIAAGTSEDCNFNLIADECEPDEDCNLNGTRDICEIAEGSSEDCNLNHAPDQCDIADGTSQDADGNGIPDECTCLITLAPVPDRTTELLVLTKNRFLSFRTLVPAQRHAVRVKFVALPSPFSALNGKAMWVGEPREISENGSSVEPIPDWPTFFAATLQCDPYFADWSEFNMVHAYHETVIPGGVYDVQLISEECGLISENNFSDALTLSTAVWGDTLSNCVTIPCSPPDGVVGILDVTAIIGRFVGDPNSITKARADLEPATLDLQINITDALRALDAFAGLPYPFAVPELPCGE